MCRWCDSSQGLPCNTLCETATLQQLSSNGCIITATTNLHLLYDIFCYGSKKNHTMLPSVCETAECEESVPVILEILQSNVALPL